MDQTFQNPSEEKAFEEGIRLEINLYKKLLELSKKEKRKIQAGANLQEIFSLLPQKVDLLDMIKNIDDEIKPLKDQWLKKKQEGISMPKNSLDLCHKLEIHIREAIDMEEGNQRKLANYQHNLSSNTVVCKDTLNKAKGLAAKKAYG